MGGVVTTHHLPIVSRILEPCAGRQLAKPVIPSSERTNQPKNHTTTDAASIGASRSVRTLETHIGRTLSCGPGPAHRSETARVQIEI